MTLRLVKIVSTEHAAKYQAIPHHMLRELYTKKENCPDFCFEEIDDVEVVSDQMLFDPRIGWTDPYGMYGFDIVLLSYGNQKVSVLKEVRKITGLNISDAKDIIETPNAVIMTGLRLDEVEPLAESLRQAGATVEIKESMKPRRGSFWYRGQ